jgi:hypothetical protein
LAFSFVDKKLLGLVVKSLEGKSRWGCTCVHCCSDGKQDCENMQCTLVRYIQQKEKRYDVHKQN